MSYQPKTYRTDGGDKYVIADGGEVEINSGGTLTMQAGSTFTIPNNAIGSAALAADVQKALPTVSMSYAGTGSNTADVTIQVQDSEGNDIADRFMVRTWTSGSDYGAPSAIAGFDITTGAELQEIVANGDLEGITDSDGKIVVGVEQSATTLYVMAVVSGLIYSLEVETTS